MWDSFELSIDMGFVFGAVTYDPKQRTLSRKQVNKNSKSTLGLFGYRALQPTWAPKGPRDRLRLEPLLFQIHYENRYFNFSFVGWLINLILDEICD